MENDSHAEPEHWKTRARTRLAARQLHVDAGESAAPWRRALQTKRCARNYPKNSPHDATEAMMQRRQRWPSWVYGGGSEPDARFSFANERTFLAWIRTAIALLAAGVVVDSLKLNLSATTQTLLAGLLVGFGMASAIASLVRWACAERAMRRGEPLPALGGGVLLVIAVVIVAVVILLGL